MISSEYRHIFPTLWSGVILDPSGYGEATRGYLRELQRHSEMRIKITPKSFHRGESVSFVDDYQWVERLHATALDKYKPYIFLQHLTPEQYTLGLGECRYHVGMTTFETDSIPGMWQMNLRAMDEIFTFSTWAKKVFEDRGVRRPITVIPHGVDVMRFNPFTNQPLPELAKYRKEGRFLIGSNFDWTERKNPGGLLRAYFSAFKATDDVMLVVKTYNQFVGENQRAFFYNYLTQIKHEMGLQRTPPVLIIDRMLEGGELPSFYASLNAYALPSRGEGWGLTYSEAMASGLPTVAVNWSGHTQFMNDDVSYLVNDYSLRQIRPEQCPNQPYYAGHRWADVNPEAFGQKMREIYDAPKTAGEVGSFAREHMVQNFTWEICAEAMAQRLFEISCDAA